METDFKSSFQVAHDSVLDGLQINNLYFGKLSTSLAAFRSYSLRDEEYLTSVTYGVGLKSINSYLDSLKK